MSKKLQHALGVATIVLTLAVAHVMKFGLYPQFFDFAWYEEVKLHDGQVIVVQVKNTHKCRSQVTCPPTATPA